MSDPPRAGRRGPRCWWHTRQPADLLLLIVTAAELAALILLTPRFAAADWVYTGSNLLVLALALLRQPARARDRSIAAAVAVLVSYAYPYAQVLLLHWRPGHETPPAAQRAGLVLVVIGAALSLAGLLTLGRSFGVRPALRGLVTTGMYRLVRHPLYLAYILQDIGYNLGEWSPGTLMLVAAGWASLLYRIRAEERVLSRSPSWPAYAERVRYRLLPGLW